MNINYATCARGKAGLDKIVVLLKVCIDDGAARKVTSEELPADGKAEEVKSVIIDEVLHLTCTIHAVILCQWRPRRTFGAVPISVATKVKARYVNTVELERASACSDRSCRC